LINVLGLPLELAKEKLERDGVTISTLEIRSKKGVEGETEARVIRQENTDENHTVLSYAQFRMKPNEANV